MRLIATISLLLSLAWHAHAAPGVVTGNVQDVTGVATSTNILFKPLSTPQASTPTVFFGNTRNISSDGSGNFSISLIGGNYQVTVGSNSANSFVIAVTNNTTNDWTSLITTSLTYHYPYSPLYVTKAGSSNYMSAPIYYNGSIDVSTQLVTKAYVDGQSGGVATNSIYATVNGYPVQSRPIMFTNGFTTNADGSINPGSGGSGGGTVGSVIADAAAASGTFLVNADGTRTNGTWRAIRTNDLPGNLPGFAAYPTNSFAGNSSAAIQSLVGQIWQGTNAFLTSLSAVSGSGVIYRNGSGVASALSTNSWVGSNGGGGTNNAFKGTTTAETISATDISASSTLVGDIITPSTELKLSNGRIRGYPSPIGSFPITGDRVAVWDVDGYLTYYDVTSAEIGWLSGVTSAIQTQIDNKTPQTFANTTSNRVASLTTALSGSIVNSNLQTTVEGNLIAFHGSDKTNGVPVTISTGLSINTNQIPFVLTATASGGGSAIAGTMVLPALAATAGQIPVALDTTGTNYGATNTIKSITMSGGELSSVGIADRIVVNLNGLGGYIQPGTVGYITLDWDFTITGYRAISADGTTNVIGVDLLYTNTFPNGSHTIVGGNFMGYTNGTSISNMAPGFAYTTLSSNSVLAFHVTNAVNAKSVRFDIMGRRK